MPGTAGFHTLLAEKTVAGSSTAQRPRSLSCAMFVEVHTPAVLTRAELDAYLARGWFRMGQTIFTTILRT
jgi:hypothetical protein